jgi:hypothetical protein
MTIPTVIQHRERASGTRPLTMIAHRLPLPHLAPKMRLTITLMTILKSKSDVLENQDLSSNTLRRRKMRRTQSEIHHQLATLSADRRGAKD